MDRYIRPARPNDAEALTALFRLSYPRLLAADYAPDILARALPQMTVAKPALLASGTYLLACASDGTLLAGGGWTRTAPGGGPSDETTGHIRHVVAHPDHLRQGHARAVLTQYLDEARMAGMTQMSCLSTRTAVPFYQALGFEIVTEVTIPVGPEKAPFPSVELTLRFESL